MTDRSAVLMVRALVVAVVGCLVAAVTAARLVLPPGSDTHVALLVITPILAALGGLVWKLPRIRFLVLWAAVGTLASFIYLVASYPYDHALRLAGWSAVAIPLYAAIGLVVFAVPIAAVALAEQARSAPVTPLGRRIRGIACLAGAIGAIVVIAAFVHGGTTRPGAGLFVAFGTFVALAPAPLVYHDPFPRRAWLWMAWMLFPACIAFGIHLLIDEALPVALRIVQLGLGTLFVLVIVVLPIVLFTSHDESESELPEARLRSQ